ncbi:MAG: response regulator transcription factor [Sulfuriferula sp.]
MSIKHRILIVEDHTLLRAGLRALLTQDPDIEIVGEADNGHDAVQAVGVLSPHLVLTDISMPGMNGIEAIRDIKRRYPETRVLAPSVRLVAASKEST